MNRRIALLVGAVAGLLLAGAAEAQYAAPAHAALPHVVSSPSRSDDWWSGYLTGSRLVGLPDGRKINLYCEGHGAPVVLLDAGLGDGASSWRTVQDKIAARTRVCAFDRAGYGRSSPGPEPRDTRAIVADMAAMLKASGEHGPYVLVGHSLASFDMRLFAFRHRNEVAGMVLVDPSADWQFQRMARVVPRVPDIAEATYAGLAVCAQEPRPERLEKVCVRFPPPDAPPAAADFYAHTQGPDYYRTLLSEKTEFDKADNEQLVAARRSLDDKPLIILTAGANTLPGLNPEETAAINKVWVEMHDEMAGLSRRGVNHVVPDVTHYIHQQKPQVVVDAVLEVVEAARR
jgi:pimeloyl-ACP methyl ester carboxylesterase